MPELTPEQRAKYRRNGAVNASAGGAVLGGAMALNYKTNKTFKRSGAPVMWDAVKNNKLSRHHARWLAGKAGVRALQVTGLPLTAVGIHHMVRPQKNKVIDPAKDVIGRTVQNAAMSDQVKMGQKWVNKAYTEADNAEVVARKKRARHLSQVSGTMGLAALGLRAPSGAAALARHSKSAANVKALARVASHAKTANEASNTLGVGAIGVGSLGSFNFARLQGLEAKRDQVRKDAFLNQYRDRISPKAEEGYRRLTTGIREDNIDAAGNAALGAGLIGYSMKDAYKKRHGLAVLGVLGGATALRSAKRNIESADRQKMARQRIKDKAVERATAGQYGEGRRPVAKASTEDLAKAFVRLRAPRLNAPYPKGILKKPAIRDGHLQRTASGKIVSVRGSIG